MKHGHPQICLFQPEIPQNTGNIGRLAAATQSRLHLVKPFGFSVDDKNLRRAGLDYWPYLDLEIHESIEDVLSLFSLEEVAFFSKKATKSYSSMSPKVKLLIFGQETSGLPEFLWEAYDSRFYNIPMFHDGVRSLNLANSVSITVYHQLYQNKLLL